MWLSDASGRLSEAFEASEEFFNVPGGKLSLSRGHPAFFGRSVFSVFSGPFGLMSAIENAKGGENRGKNLTGQQSLRLLMPE